MIAPPLIGRSILVNGAGRYDPPGCQLAGLGAMPIRPPAQVTP